MIDPARPLFRILPVALVIIGVMQLALGFMEVRISGRSTYLGATDVSAEVRWLAAMAYVRVLADGIWTLGFAAVVAAASRYLDTVGDA